GGVQGAGRPAVFRHGVGRRCSGRGPAGLVQDAGQPTVFRPLAVQTLCMSAAAALRPAIASGSWVEPTAGTAAAWAAARRWAASATGASAPMLAAAMPATTPSSIRLEWVIAAASLAQAIAPGGSFAAAAVGSEPAARGVATGETEAGEASTGVGCGPGSSPA